jgi:hypothetical protein
VRVSHGHDRGIRRCSSGGGSNAICGPACFFAFTSGPYATMSWVLAPEHAAKTSGLAIPRSVFTCGGHARRLCIHLVATSTKPKPDVKLSPNAMYCEYALVPPATVSGDLSVPSSPAAPSKSSFASSVRY